jgi:acyl-CoA thioester hydrolase
VRDGELVATGHTVHACVDRSGRVQRMPKELLERLSAGEPAQAPAPR